MLKTLYTSFFKKIVRKSIVYRNLAPLREMKLELITAW